MVTCARKLVTPLSGGLGSRIERTIDPVQGDVSIHAVDYGIETRFQMNGVTAALNSEVRNVDGAFGLDIFQHIPEFTFGRKRAGDSLEYVQLRMLKGVGSEYGGSGRDDPNSTGQNVRWNEFRRQAVG
jgi:hypothetical protein